MLGASMTTREKRLICVNGDSQFISEFETFLKREQIAYSKKPMDFYFGIPSPEQAVFIFSVTASALSIASSLIKIHEWYSSQKKKGRKGTLDIQTKDDGIQLTARDIEELTLESEKKPKKKSTKKRGKTHRTRK